MIPLPIPFNSLGSCGGLEERHWYERRDDGLLWLYGWLVGETVLKIAVGNDDAHLKEEVCPLFRPAHLLLLDHPPCDEIVDARLGWALMM